MESTYIEEDLSDDEIYFGKITLKEIKKMFCKRVQGTNKTLQGDTSLNNDCNNSLRLIKTHSQPDLRCKTDSPILYQGSPASDRNSDDSFIEMENLVSKLCLSPRNTSVELNNTLDFIDYILNHGAKLNTQDPEKKHDEDETSTKGSPLEINNGQSHSGQVPIITYDIEDEHSPKACLEISHKLQHPPVKEISVKEILVKESPVKEIPVKESPVKEILVKESPVKETSVKETSAKESPVKAILVKETNVKERFIKNTPVKNTLLKTILAKETLAKNMLIKETPLKKTFVQETPIKEILVKETPVKKILVKETHVKEILVKETPEKNTLKIPEQGSPNYYTPAKNLTKPHNFASPSSSTKFKTKTPSCSFLKKSSTPRNTPGTRINAYGHIASPIATYIRQSPQVPLVRDVHPKKPLPGTSSIPKVIKKAECKTQIVKNKENVNLPSVAYKSAKKTKVIHLPEVNRLPYSQWTKKMTSSLPTVMKHENRKIQQLPSNLEDSLVNLSGHQAEVSLCTQKTAFKSTNKH